MTSASPPRAPSLVACWTNMSPAEIHLLPNLTGYLKFAGNYPIARVKLQYKARPDVIDPMVMAEQYSKPIRGSAGIFAGA